MSDRQKIAAMVLPAIIQAAGQSPESDVDRALLYADLLISATKPAVKKQPVKDLDSPTVNTIPTTAFNARGEVFRVTSDMVDQWQDTYPELDVIGQIQAAKQWCIDNPAKRKTLTGMRKFLGSWISRAQNRGDGGGQNNRASGQGGKLSGAEKTRRARDELRRKESEGAGISTV